MRTCRECKGEDKACEWCEGTGEVGEVVYLEQMEAEINMQERMILALRGTIAGYKERMCGVTGTLRKIGHLVSEEV